MTQLLEADSFWELLECRVEASGDQLMLVDDTDRRLTFAEFRDEAERVAAGLFNLGITEGTPVSWQLPTRIETVILSFALSRLGAVQNPIIHIYRHREVGFCINETKAAVMFHSGVWGDFDYEQMCDDIFYGDIVFKAGMTAPPALINGYKNLPTGDPTTLPPSFASSPTPPAHTSLAIRWKYYTSGTTADPKGVCHTDASLIAGGTGLAKALNMTADDVGSIAFPYAHIGGPDYMVTMLASGFGSVLMERFVPAEAVKLYRKHGVTMAGGSTAFYSMFCAEDKKATETTNNHAVPTLRVLSGGGAPKPPEVYYEVREQMGIPVAHGYGMTECPMISQGSPDDTDEQLANTDGKPVFGCEVSITDADGNNVDTGTEGEIRVAGSMLFAGYTNPDLDAFDDQGRFRTGDLGIIRPDGHLVLTGRLKDIIIRKGENISAKEIEDVLYTLPNVAAVAVIGLADPERGERVCAVIESATDTEPLTLKAMVDACETAGLARQKIPEQLEIYPGPLPRNATLKILKHELRDVYG